MHVIGACKLVQSWNRSERRWAVCGKGCGGWQLSSFIFDFISLTLAQCVVWWSKALLSFGIICKRHGMFSVSVGLSVPCVVQLLPEVFGKEGEGGHCGCGTVVLCEVEMLRC